MLFKHCTALVFDPQRFDPTLSDIEQAVSFAPARECQADEREHIGFDVVGPGRQVQVLPLDGERVFYLRLRLDQRVLPKAAVKREVRKRIAKMAQDGIELSSADRRQLADDTEAQLLSTALQKDQHIQLLIDKATGEIWVDQSAAGKVDAAIGCLRKALGSCPAVLMEAALGEGYLKTWALEPTHLPGDLDLSGEIKLATDDQASINAKREDLTVEQWQDLIGERQVQELGVANEYWSTRLTAALNMKSIKAVSQQETGEDLESDLEVTVGLIREMRQWFDEATHGALRPVFHTGSRPTNQHEQDDQREAG